MVVCVDWNKNYNVYSHHTRIILHQAIVYDSQNMECQIALTPLKLILTQGGSKLRLDKEWQSIPTPHQLNLTSGSCMLLSDIESQITLTQLKLILTPVDSMLRQIKVCHRILTQHKLYLTSGNRILPSEIECQCTVCSHHTS